MPVTAPSTDPLIAFKEALDRAAQEAPFSKLVLAVSGGGDSIAMMHMAERALDASCLTVVSVDHGLRAEASAEIALVAEQADRLGIQHEVLSWTWDKVGNLQAAARVGRWELIHSFARAQGSDAVLLGHTEDDQVETLLLRLSRGSGIDGLTGMVRDGFRDGMRVIRPLLDIARDDLRAWLNAQKIFWADDPSNDDPRFARVRARQMFGQLQTLGMTRKRLLQTVDHAQAAQRSLRRAALDFARSHVTQDTGDLIFDRDALRLDREDAPRRVMAAAVTWISGNTYRPRFDSLMDTVVTAAGGKTATLGGVVFCPQADRTVRLTREEAATHPLQKAANVGVDATGIIWDGRWFLEGEIEDDLAFQALGKGIEQCPEWRKSGLPRRSLLASPSVWREDQLIAAPLAGISEGWTAQIVADFHKAAFAH